MGVEMNKIKEGTEVNSLIDFKILNPCLGTIFKTTNQFLQYFVSRNNDYMKCVNIIDDPLDASELTQDYMPNFETSIATVTIAAVKWPLTVSSLETFAKSIADDVRLTKQMNVDCFNNSPMRALIQCFNNSPMRALIQSKKDNTA